jgi:hypothetical protein
MDHKALKKAQMRFEVAQVAAEALRHVQTFKDFAIQWYLFLHAAKGVYTTLEQGAKISAQSRQWFGRKNQERKKDPLLRYVSEARNDDEHGIEDAINLFPSVLHVGGNAPGASRDMVDPWGNRYVDCGPMRVESESFTPPPMPLLRPLDGKPLAVEFTPARAVLKPVHDRERRRHNPPTEHRGKPLQSGSPQEVADLMSAYLAELLAEAEGLSTP